MKSSARLAWSLDARKIPESINAQLVGTFPSIASVDGKLSCAIFVRATEDEFNGKVNGKNTECLVRPQLVKTPQGPLIVVYCMITSDVPSEEPFISETAIFPRLLTMHSHSEIAELLKSRNGAYYIVCNEKGECFYNAKARVLKKWRSELAEKSKAFTEGMQITDEKSAIMSLYWYQERYNPSSKIFEIKN